MAPGGVTPRYSGRFGENVLRHGSHEWLPYSKNAVCTKSSNTNLSNLGRMPFCFYLSRSTTIPILYSLLSYSAGAMSKVMTQ